MEQYVYSSIIFFSLIISFLYIYIIYEKIVETHKTRKTKEYSTELVPYLDTAFSRIMEGQSVEVSVLEYLKDICRNKTKKEIVEERITYYLENFKGDFLSNLTLLCEEIGLVQYEINNLKNKNDFKRALSCKRLGQFRSRKAIIPLLNEINTKNSDVKYNILLALAKIGDQKSFIKAFSELDLSVILSERSLIEIVDSFEGDKDKIYKSMINSSNNFISCIFIKSAGNYRDTSLGKDISKYLFSEDKEKRIAAVKALGTIGDERYLNEIIKLLQDEKWEVRAVTAKALGNFTNEKIMTPLFKALSDSQWYVRYNSAVSLLNYEGGFAAISYVFQRDDNFAKDIIISAIENSSYSKNLYLFENSEDDFKRKIALKVKNYIEQKGR